LIKGRTKFFEDPWGESLLFGNEKDEGKIQPPEMETDFNSAAVGRIRISFSMPMPLQQLMSPICLPLSHVSAKAVKGQGMSGATRIL
jgi:hypothetical protein